MTAPNESPPEQRKCPETDTPGTLDNGLTTIPIVPLGQIPCGVAAALEIADRGWSVFRVSLKQTEDGKWIKTPHNWAASATRDPAKIRRMWSGRNANSYIGFKLGDGAVGIDIDNKGAKHGQEWWESQGFDILLDYTYETLSGGWHCLAATDEQIGCPQLWAKHGVDIKGEGGWFFAHAVPPRKSELPRLPGPLLAALRRPEPRERRSTNATVRDPALGLHPYAERAIGYELARLDACAAGEADKWNSTTYEVSINLIEFGRSPWSGYTVEQAHADLFEHAPQDPGFGPKEIEKCWQSALQKAETEDKDRPEPEDHRSTPEEVFESYEDDDPVPTSGSAVDPWMSNLVPGDRFILNAPDHVVPLWGTGSQVLWAQGEALMIAGPQGVGKTTLVGQVVRALMVGGQVLGLPVKKRDHVLYLAMDRPAQIARSIGRTLRDLDPDFLRRRITFWKGPPPADLAKDTGALLRLARLAGADTVIIDSLKDAALKLSEDETGSAYNRARQTVLAAGVEVVELHHMVKTGNSGKGSKPTSLPDVYGSVWLTSGVGSVVLLWGDPGDLVVEMTHLKQPAETVGPLSVAHDHDAGTSTVHDPRDIVGFARGSKDGVTAKDVADFLYSGDTSPNRVAQARRRLTALTKSNQLAIKVAGDKTTPTVWVANHPLRPPITAADSAESSTDPP